LVASGKKRNPKPRVTLLRVWRVNANVEPDAQLEFFWMLE
jgi:hypothetical protein